MFTYRNLIFCGVFLFYIILVKGAGYDHLRQAKWYDDYEECSLTRQSPIELITNEAFISHDMPDISFVHYETPYRQPVRIENNGHTIDIQLPKCYSGTLWQIYDNLLPHITGGPLSPTDAYIADRLHFHWGSGDTHGSEHVVDNIRYALELHIVHRNSKYNSVEEALSHADGLAVLGVLYTVEPSSDTDFDGLNDVINAMESVAKFGESSEISDFQLDTLFSGLDRTEFFTYAGSLTTPPCSQAVTWIVFTQTIQVSHAQMDRFRHVTDSNGYVMENNYRFLQPKGSRTVYLKPRTEETTTETPLSTTPA